MVVTVHRMRRWAQRTPRALRHVHTRALVVSCVLASSCFTTLVAHAQERSDYFIDIDGEAHDFQLSYDKSFGAAAGKPNYLRAAIENAALLGFGFLWYMSNPTANSDDWEVTSVHEKLNPKELRFDNNQFTTNMLLHPVSGGGYYGLARLNKLGVLPSFLYAFAASAIWEYLFEWREKVSINDMIMTPVGGVVTGEVFSKIAQYVMSGPHHAAWPRVAARYTIALPAEFHTWLGDPRPDDGGLPVDPIDSSTAYFHDFRLGYAASYVSNDAGEHVWLNGVVGESEIIAMPGFLRPGRFSLAYSNGNLTEMIGRLDYGEGGLNIFDFWFRAVLFGYYEQALSLERDGRPAPLHGYAYSIGFAGAFSNQQRWLMGRRDDASVLHFAGPAFDGWLVAGPFQTRATLDGSLDFAAIRPLAYDAFREAHPDGTTKSVLEAYGYDFYWGASARLTLSSSCGPLELGTRFAYGRYSTISGFDRYQERITLVAESTDEIIDGRFWLALRVPRTPLELRLHLTTRLRTGQTQEVHEQRWERMAASELRLRF